MLESRQRRYDIAGWALFGIGCLAFLSAGIRNGDIFTILGSLLFLVGVIAFLIPYTWSS
jgi:hypothetical protein